MVRNGTNLVAVEIHQNTVTNHALATIGGTDETNWLRAAFSTPSSFAR